MACGFFRFVNIIINNNNNNKYPGGIHESESRSLELCQL